LLKFYNCYFYNHWFILSQTCCFLIETSSPPTTGPMDPSSLSLEPIQSSKSRKERNKLVQWSELASRQFLNSFNQYKTKITKVFFWFINEFENFKTLEISLKPFKDAKKICWITIRQIHDLPNNWFVKFTIHGMTFLPKIFHLLNDYLPKIYCSSNDFFTKSGAIFLLT